MSHYWLHTPDCKLQNENEFGDCSLPARDPLAHSELPRAALTSEVSAASTPASSIYSTMCAWLLETAVLR